MGSGADRGSFLGADSSATKIMQLEINQRRITRAFEETKDSFSDRARQHRNTGRIPHFHQQSFQVVGQPWKLRIGILNG